MKKIMTVFFILAFCISAWAGVLVNTETLTILTSATKSMTAAQIKDDTKQGQYAKRALCTVSGGQINFTYDGTTTPTTTVTGVGHYLQIGDKLVLTRYSEMRDFQAIAATVTATLTCSYEF